jgi:hypothetical protein
MKFVVRVKLEEGFGKGPAEMEIICRDNRTGHALHSLIQFPWAALVTADGMGGAPAKVMKKGYMPGCKHSLQPRFLRHGNIRDTSSPGPENARLLTEFLLL